jgi:CheY-like chemotaxis protein
LPNDHLPASAYAEFHPEHDDSPTVLIVEDNEIVCDFLQNACRAYGYRTLMAATPQQAMEHCRREPNAIDILIADVRLGGGDGFETAQMLQRICPRMKLVFMSGYPREYLVRAGRLPASLGMSTFLQKPFAPRDMIAVLRSVQRPS